MAALRTLFGGQFTALSAKRVVLFNSNYSSKVASVTSLQLNSAHRLYTTKGKPQISTSDSVVVADQDVSEKSAAAAATAATSSLEQPEQPRLTASHLLDKEIADFVQEICPTFKEHQVRTHVAMRVMYALKAIYGYKANTLPFGSFVTYTYLPSGDIDIHLDLPKHMRIAMTDELTPVATEDVTVDQLALKLIPYARVPLIKVSEKLTGVQLDLSFRIGKGVPQGQVGGVLVRRLMDKYKGKLYPLTMVIKYMLARSHLNDPADGGLGSYATTLMIVSMFQQQQKLQPRVTQISNPEGLGQSLVDFLDLYGNKFNFAQKGIRVNDDGEIFDKAVSPEFPYPPRFDRLLVVDPLNPCNDVTASSRRIDEIAELFSNSLERLQKRM
ncbi:hypothetical protein GQ42DRAFT_133703, partial [Ramicandelaber brevisporus]